MILLAACRDGFGHKSFFHWFRHQELDEFEKALRENYEIYGQTAYATLSKARAYRVILVSELGEEETRQMGMEKAADLDQALRHGPGAASGQPENRRHPQRRDGVAGSKGLEKRETAFTAKAQRSQRNPQIPWD